MFPMKPRDDTLNILGSITAAMDRRKLIHITIVILGKTLYPPVSQVTKGNIAGSVVVGEANKCSADAMSRCTDPLKVVTDNKDLGFATSKDELDEMCP